jgi:hypothetical protein
VEAEKEGFHRGREVYRVLGSVWGVMLLVIQSCPPRQSSVSLFTKPLSPSAVMHSCPSPSQCSHIRINEPLHGPVSPLRPVSPDCGRELNSPFHLKVANTRAIRLSPVNQAKKRTKRGRRRKSSQPSSFVGVFAGGCCGCAWRPLTGIARMAAAMRAEISSFSIVRGGSWRMRRM